MSAVEANFDGLVGPTHNYAGLSHGNVASVSHGGDVSRPRQAALEGLAKMRTLAGLGLVQGILPPHERPDVAALRRLGFSGSDAEVIGRAAKEAPRLLASVCSASPMWAANAATVAPSADTADGRVHFTPANLRSTLHRALEPEQTSRALRRVFPDDRFFAHHAPLPASTPLGDEGAANHTRLHAGGDGPGVHLFVWGRHGLGTGADAPAPRRYPARQTLEASEAVARLHGVAPERTVFVQQNPDVIDRGVFHNDVISVGHGRVFLHHEEAFVDTDAAIAAIDRALDGALVPIRVRAGDVSVDEAVRTYLFNSQLVTLPDGRVVLIAPVECEESAPVQAFVDAMIADSANPVAEVRTMDVRQSMRNGGGPACLRLRVVLTDEERAAVHAPCLVDDATHAKLVAWVEKHYREELRPADLADPHLLDESRAALDELTTLLDLGPAFYPFQREGNGR